jgi:(p)ppGpp synthase/HD superfamily hydrolase
MTEEQRNSIGFVPGLRYDPVQEALDFAAKAHAMQDYDGLPYHVHGRHVLNVLIQAGATFDVDAYLDICIAAPLHDVLEDTHYSYNDLAKRFGSNVAEIVFCVSDAMGRNRQERHLGTACRLRSNQQARCLKLADRLANLQWSRMAESRMRALYLREHPQFEEELRSYQFRRTGTRALGTELNVLEAKLWLALDAEVARG